MNEQMTLDQMQIYALKSDAGHVLVLGGTREDNSAMFMTGESSVGAGVVGFRLRANTAAQIMLNARTLAGQFRRGSLTAEILLPFEQAVKMKVMASFDLLTGNVENVSDDAGGAWRELSRAASPVTFLTPTKDARLIRDLTQEVMTGVLQTPAGEVAIRTDEGWMVVDVLDSECVSDVILPHLLARRKTKDWDQVYADLLSLVPAYVAECAIEAYDETVLDGLKRPEHLTAETRDASGSSVESFADSPKRSPRDPRSFPEGPDMR